jgi:hypothetical protein
MLCLMMFLVYGMTSPIALADEDPRLTTKEVFDKTTVGFAGMFVRPGEAAASVWKAGEDTVNWIGATTGNLFKFLAGDMREN